MTTRIACFLHNVKFHVFYLLDPTEHRGDCLEGWEAYGDSCFFFSDEKKSWFDAEATCAEVPGSHLASCINGKDFAFLSKKKPQKPSRWIGIDDL